MTLLLPNSAMIHVPKTGGSWCRESINKAGLRRRELGQFHDFAKKHHRHLANLFVFGFVRNPVTWMQSRWCYTKRANKKTAHWSDDFNEWVGNILDAQPGLILHGMLERLGYSKAGDPSEYVVDFVGKNELL